jgi:hypothetical protein
MTNENSPNRLANGYTANAPPMALTKVTTIIHGPELSNCQWSDESSVAACPRVSNFSSSKYEVFQLLKNIERNKEVHLQEFLIIKS